VKQQLPLAKRHLNDPPTFVLYLNSKQADHEGRKHVPPNHVIDSIRVERLLSHGCGARTEVVGEVVDVVWGSRRVVVDAAVLLYV
jgi:hypothetical protein